MISILVIDDDDAKIARVSEVLSRCPMVSSEDIIKCGNLVSAREILSVRRFDLLILDMRIPQRIDEDPDLSGGTDLLKEISVSKVLFKPFHIIGLTAYSDGFEDVDSVFREEVWRIIHYRPGEATWERQLLTKVLYLVASKQELARGLPDQFQTDLAIVAALRVPELEAVLDLPGSWVEQTYPNDSTIYHVGSFERGGKKLRVVSASAPQMGMPATAVLSMKIVERFRPKFLVMTGIAAGIRGSVNLGDIVIGDQFWDYGSGKRRIKDGKSVLLPDFKSIPLAHELKEKFLHIQAEGKLIFEVSKKWRGDTPGGTPLSVHIGPIASGAAVIQDPQVTEEIREHCRKLSAIDMEAYGVMYSADGCIKPRPTAFVIKSVCDFADEVKDDQFQRYAAYTSANFLYEFSLSEYFG